MQKTLVALLSSILVALACAQPRAGLTAYAAYTYFPAVGLAEAPEEWLLSEEDVSQSVSRFGVKQVSLFNDRSTILIVNGDWQSVRITYNEWERPDTIYAPESFHAVTAGVTLVQRLSRPLFLSIFARPGLHSDMKDVIEDDFRLQGGALLDIYFSRYSAVGLGVYYGSDFGESQMLPLLHVKAGSELVAFDATLPRELSLLYLASDNVSAGIRAEIRGSQFRVGEDVEYAEFDILKFTNGFAGPTIIFSPSPTVEITCLGGMTFLRRADLYDGDEEIVSLEAENGIMMRAGLSYRLGSRGRHW